TMPENRRRSLGGTHGEARNAFAGRPDIDDPRPPLPVLDQPVRRNHVAKMLVTNADSGDLHGWRPSDTDAQFAWQLEPTSSRLLRDGENRAPRGAPRQHDHLGDPLVRRGEEAHRRVAR